MSKPGDRRALRCPRCDRAIEVSKLTKSTLCSGCHRTMRTEDETVSDYQARAEYFNEACVEVAKKGVIISEVRVRSLVVKGEVKGPIRAREGQDPQDWQSVRQPVRAGPIGRGRGRPRGTGGGRAWQAHRGPSSGR